MMFKVQPYIAVQNPYCVYTIEDSSGTVQYIGCTKYSSILRTPDARRNHLFTAVFPHESTMLISIIATFEKRMEATNYIHTWLYANPRPFMLQFGRASSHRFVRCIETGEIFNTLNEIAEKHDVSQSYISRHMRGDEGCEKIRGFYSFEWVMRSM